MRVKQGSTQQVRISSELCELVAKSAHLNRRTFRAELELLVETGLGREATPTKETREEVSRGE